MRPDELLPTKRTLSIGSRVPPAVIEHASRPSSPPPARRSARRRAPRRRRARRRARASQAASSSGGSARRPTPSSPFDASAADAGLDDRARRARAASRGSPASRGARTCGCSSPARRPAGSVAASARCVSRLSASPRGELGDRVRARPARSGRRRRCATSSRWLSGSCAGSGSPGNAPRIGSRSNSLTSTGAPRERRERRLADEAPAGRRLDRRAPRARRAVARRTSSSAL